MTHCTDQHGTCEEDNCRCEGDFNKEHFAKEINIPSLTIYEEAQKLTFFSKLDVVEQAQLVDFVCAAIQKTLDTEKMREGFEESKVWKCPCGKPAMLFECCSQECQKKYGSYQGDELSGKEK